MNVPLWMSKGLSTQLNNKFDCTRLNFFAFFAVFDNTRNTKHLLNLQLNLYQDTQLIVIIRNDTSVNVKFVTHYSTD